jgi:tRNA pseudouridine38-40 synthase
VAHAGADSAGPADTVPLSAPRTYRLVLAYDGTGFNGWQIQPQLPTVQGALLAAARALLGDEVRVIGASRTDAGVHALGQTASLVAGSALTAAAVQAALNGRLPREVRIVSATESATGFDARRAARGKRYLYLIDDGPVPAPLLRRYAWHVGGRLDVTAMRQALASLRGRHDFGAFCAAPGRAADPTCDVRAVHVRRRKAVVAVALSADRFLHHMVRNVVGSAVEVGRGAEPPGWLAEVLRSRDRTRAGPTAPPQGLTLLRVLY